MVDQFDLLYQLQLANKRKLKPQKKIANILPDADVDLAPYFAEMVPIKGRANRNLDRWDIENHWKTLRYESRGKPEAIALVSLCISYLRRQTPYTEQAWTLFERLWRDHTSAVLEYANPRMIVSSFRTFCDHDPDERRMLRAKICFTYAHMLKLYESERLNDGHDLAAVGFDIPAPCPKIGVDQLWGVRYGGDNSLEIVHMLLAEEVTRDDVLGPMILQLMARISEGDTIFSRFDRKRAASGFQTENDANWSFGGKPLDLGEDEA